MKFLIVAALLALSAAPSLAESLDRVLIIDGDTVDINGERIRIFNIDAPETFRSRCPDELILGLKTKERLAQLLRAGWLVIERCEPDTGRCTDRFGRTLARVRSQLGDVGATLIAEGLAEPWKPGKAAAAQRLSKWCPRP